MKRYVLFGFMLSLVFIVSSCGNSLDIEKCEELIRGHSFMKLRHVNFTRERLPEECETVLAGIVEGGFAKVLDKKDGIVYYYYLYGFDIKNVRNLVIDKNMAFCEFDLIEANWTPASKYKKDDRIDKQGMICRATFACFEDTGWRLDGIQCSEKLFTINGWNNETNSIETVCFK